MYSSVTLTCICTSHSGCVDFEGIGFVFEQFGSAFLFYLLHFPNRVERHCF